MFLLACVQGPGSGVRVSALGDSGATGADSGAETHGDSAATLGLPAFGEGNGTLRFLAFGDWGMGTSTQSLVAGAMETVCAASGCDLAVLVGDNFYPSGVESTSDAYWEDRFESVYTLDMPYLAVLGNHDWGESGHGYVEANAQAQVDYSALSERWTMPDKTWTDDRAGLVSFVGLDTTTIDFGYGADQEAWIDGALDAAPNPWRIVLGHHPYRSNGPHGDAGVYDGVSGKGDEMEAFFEDHLCGVADVYIAGHDHSLQWPESPCDMELLVSGGGASNTSLTGTDAAWFEAESAGFAWLEATTERLGVVFYDQDAVELYRGEIVK